MHTVTSQIAIKPFKINKLRRSFLERLKTGINDHFGADEFSVLLGGKTTIDIQRKGVDKRKAIIELITMNKFNPQHMIYFGDEFVPNGNDLRIAEMPKNLRPARIIHIGDTDKTPAKLRSQSWFYIDGNGPEGTLNYLRFLQSELA